MWSIQQLEFAIKVASLRARRTPSTICKYRGKNEAFEYSCTVWAFEILEDYVRKHKNSGEDSAEILEDFMGLMDEWEMSAKTEQAKNAFVTAHDYAELLYDSMFEW